MAASSVAEAFDWTPFSHGFVFWESPKAGQREWLEGFQQAHADYPNEPDHPEGGETAADALRRMLPGHPYLPALLAL